MIRWCKKRCQGRTFTIAVNVRTDNNQEKQFIIQSNNIHVTQTVELILPVARISYSVIGFGNAFVHVDRIFMEEEQQQIQNVPFQLTQQFSSMAWVSEIIANTCLTYTCIVFRCWCTPATKNKRLGKEYVNVTMVIEVELSSGKRKYFI
jgi:hypothetical protein